MTHIPKSQPGSWRALASLAALAATLAPAVTARAQASIDFFQADATVVPAGSWVNFGVGWSIQGGFQNGGGSDPVEPAPVEGWNEWVLNWYWTESITPQAINIAITGAGSVSFNEVLSGAPGSGASGSVGFQLLFDQPGSYQLQATGDFAVQQTSTYQSEVATRNCYNIGEPDAGVVLQCDSWSYSYPYQTSDSSWGGSMNALSLQIEVQAVPEPTTWALWLAGVAAVAGAALSPRRRRPHAC